MRGIAHLVVPILCVACASSVDVTFDESQDFTAYRSWSWLPGSRGTVDAPLNDALTLDRRMARLVETELRARGFERAETGADFFVSYHLRVRKQFVTETTTPAEEQLASLHNSPNIKIQATEREEHVYEKGALVLAVADTRDRRVVWSAVLRGRFRDDIVPHLEEAVRDLLERFPPHAPDGD